MSASVSSARGQIVYFYQANALLIKVNDTVAPAYPLCKSGAIKQHPATYCQLTDPPMFSTEKQAGQQEALLDRKAPVVDEIMFIFFSVLKIGNAVFVVPKKVQFSCSSQPLPGLRHSKNQFPISRRP